MASVGKSCSRREGTGGRKGAGRKVEGGKEVGLRGIEVTWLSHPLGNQGHSCIDDKIIINYPLKFLFHSCSRNYCLVSF